MTDNKNVYFRTSVGGFNKTDVNEYILKISKDFSEKESALRERAELAEKEIAELESKLYIAEEFRSKNEELQKSLDLSVSEKEKLEFEISELRESYDEASKEKLSEQEAIIAKQFEELDALREEIQLLKEKLSDNTTEKEKNEELTKKAQLYDKTSANIGETLLSAKKTADEIVAAAREEARVIVESAQNEMNEKRRIAEDSTTLAFQSIYSKLVSAASENRREISSASTFATKILEEALYNINSRNKSVAAKVKSYEDTVWRSIKGDLDTIGSLAKASSVDERKKRNKK